MITIDGPTGSGKGTIGRLLARKLGWRFLDSGILYRALAYAVDFKKISLDDIKAIQDLITLIHISDDGEVRFENQDITQSIRTEICGSIASKIAAKPLVREALLQWQRDYCKSKGLVADGRDMGTVVFPNARWKFFLTATPEERAQRRYEQLKRGGVNVNLADVLRDLLARDERDMKRLVAPLKPANDAIYIDTTKLTIDEILQIILEHINF